MAIFNISMSMGLATGPILGGIIADLGGVTPIFYLGGPTGATGPLSSSRLWQKIEPSNSAKSAWFVSV